VLPNIQEDHLLVPSLVRIRMLGRFGKENTTQMNKITGWIDDKKFLEATAALIFQDPEDLWEDLCKKTGVKVTYRQMQRGRQFPFSIRNELRNTYNKRMAIEIKIAKDCMEQSKKEFRKIVPYIILVVVIVLTILVS